MRRHPARRISVDEIGELFCQAYVKSATIENAAAGFRASGIYPFNHNILPDTDFLQDPRVSSDDVSPLTTPNIDTSSSVSVVPSLEPPTSNLPSTPSNAEADVPQSTVHFDVSTQDDNNANESIENTSPSFADILPVPQLKAKQSKRKSEQSEILTSSPYKKVLREQNENRVERNKNLKSTVKKNDKKTVKNVEKKVVKELKSQKKFYPARNQLHQKSIQSEM